MRLDFTVMTNLRYEAELLSMMCALYAEDQGTSPVDQARFPISIAFPISHPSRGRVVLCRESGSLCGYALLIPYWSNEFSGTLLFVDEIFIIPEARNKGIGKQFFRYLVEQRPFDAVALALETSPGNNAARRLYESLGFHQRENAVFTHCLSGSGPEERSVTIMSQQPVKSPFTEEAADPKGQDARKAAIPKSALFRSA